MDDHRGSRSGDPGEPLPGQIETLRDHVAALPLAHDTYPLEQVAAAGALALIAGLLTVLYAGPGTALVRESWLDGDWLAKLLAIGLCLAMTPWRRLRAPGHVDLRGLTGIAAGCALLLFGQLSADFYTTRLSFVVLLAALLATFRGLPALGASAVLLLALASAIPLPLVVQTQFIGPLRATAAIAATRLIEWSGGAAYREAGELLVGRGAIAIASVCANLRLLGPTFAIALLFAVRYRQRWPSRLLLLLAVVPLAIAVDAVHLVAVAEFGSTPAFGVFESSTTLMRTTVLLLATAVLVGLARTGAVKS